MNAKAWRLYAAGDARLEDVELEGAGEDGVVVEIVTNTICLSDYKAVSLGTGHKRVPKDIATNPTMFGHEISGIVREVGARWASQFAVGQRVCIQPAFNIPGHELETMGYAWHSIGGVYKEGDATYVDERRLTGKIQAVRVYNRSLSDEELAHNRMVDEARFKGNPKGGTMLLMAGCGAMGLGCIDIACHSPEKRPRRLVVTDIDDARLARAARMFEMVGNGERGMGNGGVVACGTVNGVELVFVNTKGWDDPVAKLKALNSDEPVDASNPTSTGGGYDDIFLFAAVPALITQCSDLLAFGGCLNFFAGPTDQKLSASFNFYNIHYMNHHVVANSGGDVKDMSDSVDWIGRGILHPEVMITHVGGLDSAFQATLDLPKVPGGKRLVYTHVEMPMTAIADFAEKGAADPFYAELDRLCSAHSGLWCKEAEDYLLAHAPKVAIGDPKAKIVERRIVLCRG